MNVLLVFLLLVGRLFAEPAGLPVLTLQQALDEAASHPELLVEQSNAKAAWAAARQVRSVLLPQIQGTALVRRARSTGSSSTQTGASSTANSADTASSGSMGTASSSDPSTTTGTGDPSSSSTTGGTSSLGTGGSFAFQNGWLAEITVNQLLWNGGSAWENWQSARQSARAAESDVGWGTITVRQNVRNAFFAARAAREQVEVAQETLANQERHLEQVASYIEVGLRPEIDRAQARADLANARVLLIEAESSWNISRWQLDQAIGWHPKGVYDIAKEEFPAVEGEDDPLENLVARAMRRRPDVTALTERMDAADATVRSMRGSYAPNLSGDIGAAALPAASGAAFNLNGGLTLSVPVFLGGRTHALVSEAKARADAASDQLEVLGLQVWLDVAAAQTNVGAARASLEATGEALAAAHDRLELAQGRYETGIGDAVELGDSQLAATQAALQDVRARYNLATARSSLRAALGEE